MEKSLNLLASLFPVYELEIILPAEYCAGQENLDGESISPSNGDILGN